ncbi:MAG: hypothetical protein J6B72_06360 [Clostridia bacterium]|nr:hypothetical protein [Clostridia bacterium]
MKCPKCGREMELGYFYGQRALWSKSEDKFTILKGKDDLKISASGSDAYRCENCCKIIVVIDY